MLLGEFDRRWGERGVVSEPKVLDGIDERKELGSVSLEKTRRLIVLWEVVSYGGVADVAKRRIGKSEAGGTK